MALIVHIHQFFCVGFLESLGAFLELVFVVGIRFFVVVFFRFFGASRSLILRSLVFFVDAVATVTLNKPLLLMSNAHLDFTQCLPFGVCLLLMVLHTFLT